MRRPRKTYDREYFDRWYRNPELAVIQKDLLARRVHLAVAVAEYILDRHVRTVLDVGCGEGAWRALLRKLRPRASYTGIDSSEYVVRRYGKRRGIRHARFGEIGSLRLRTSYDLIVCSDVLHYVPRRELRPGLQAIADHLEGVAFLEFFADEDEVIGDHEGLHARSAESYRRVLRRVGLIPIGLHGYVHEDRAGELTALERAFGGE